MFQTHARKVHLCCWCWSGEESWLLLAEFRLRSWEGPSAVCTLEVKVRHTALIAYWKMKHFNLQLFIIKTFEAACSSRITSELIWSWKISVISNKYIHRARNATCTVGHVRFELHPRCSALYAQVHETGYPKYFVPDWQLSRTNSETHTIDTFPTI